MLWGSGIAGEFCALGHTKTPPSLERDEGVEFRGTTLISIYLHIDSLKRH